MIEKDRRASPRFNAKPGDNVYYIEGAGAIRDLSMNGLFVLDAEPLPVGTNISFSLTLGNETVMFQGIVQRCVEQEGMGIQFTEMSPYARRRLRLHIGEPALS
jgi:PilZ domain